MTETNHLEAALLRRGSPVHTDIIFIVVGASLAGAIAIGVLVFVLVRCSPKRRKKASLSGILEESQPSRVDFHHSFGDSFIQSPPFTFPEVSALGAQEPNHRLTSIRRSFQEDTGVAVAWDGQSILTAQSATRPWTPQEAVADIEPPFTSSIVETGTHFPDTSGLKRRSSVPTTESVYSNASLPISQHSVALGSSSPNVSRLASIRPALQTIPASPYGVYPPRSSPTRNPNSKLPEKSILKASKSPSPTPAPISHSHQPSFSSTVHGTRSVRSGLPASPYGPPTTQPRPPPSRLRPIDEPPTPPLSNTQEVVSQHSRSSPSHSFPSPVPETPSSEPPPSGRSIDLLLTPPSQPPLSPHRVSSRKSRPEPLRLRPHDRDSYASVRYARSRAPSDASDARNSVRTHVRVHAAINMRADAAILRSSVFVGGDNQEKQPRTHTPSPEQASPGPPQPLVRSPTWSTFRGLPGYI